MKNNLTFDKAIFLFQMSRNLERPRVNNIDCLHGVFGFHNKSIASRQILIRPSLYINVEESAHEMFISLAPWLIR